MPRKKRLIYQGTYCHLFNRGVAKQDVFLDDHDRKTFLHILGVSLAENKSTLYSYCLMGNHFHLFVRSSPHEEDQALTISRLMWQLSGGYVRYFNRKYNRVGPLFQGRFQHRWVDSASYCLSVVRYIHKNPLEASLVQDLIEYKWSSYRSYIRLDPQWPWLNTEWILGQIAAPSQNDETVIKLFSKFHQMEEVNSQFQRWPKDI